MHKHKNIFCAAALIPLIAVIGCGDTPLTDGDSHQRMVEELAVIAERSADENIFVGDRKARTLRAELRNLPADAPPLRRWLRLYQLSTAELHLGNESEAIRLLNAANDEIKDNPQQIKADVLRRFYFDMAVAYLRLGETQNCCQQNTPDSCIVPIQGQAIHTNEEGSRQAIAWLTKVLASSDPNDPMHLATQWLLNLAHMTLGEYPDKVASEHLIPGIADLSQDEKTSPWKNIAADSGVATFSMAGGAIADDLDNDGDIDLIVSSWDPKQSLRLFWNDGAGKFSDGTQAAGLQSINGGLNIVQTDYDNDGHIDIFVMRGGWLAAAGQHPNSLLRNNGDGTFTDITFQSRLADINYPTQAAAWSDFDLDGDLDIYIGNESTPDLAAPSQLFRNNGDGTFTDIAKKAGVTNDLLAKAVTWGDYDNDRYPDLYVSNYRGANRLYRNLGNGTFEDVASSLNVDGPDASFPTWFFDANNDGKLDLFVAAYSGGIAEVAASLLNKPFDRDAALPRLYFADSSGDKISFTNQAETYGLVHPTHPMGSNFGDLNNDGFPDIYLGTGWPEYHELMPNVMYVNQSGTNFTDVTNAARVGHLQKGHAVALADFDNDGDLDLFEQMGGFVPGDKYYDVLFDNPGSGQGWIKVKLVGNQSNRAGIGACIHLRVTDGTTERSIYRTVSSGGSFGASPFEQHIGIGDATKIVRLQVFWPVTGETDVLTNIEPKKRTVIKEGTTEN